MRIRELRVQDGLTQIELAKIIGVAQNTLSNWENGNREPDNATLAKIADYFHVSIDYILGRTDDPIDYEDGDFLAGLNPDILDYSGGNARKAYAVQKAIDEDAKNEAPRRAIENEIKLDDIQFALYGEVKELSDEDKKKILDFARFVKEQNKKK